MAFLTLLSINNINSQNIESKSVTLSSTISPVQLPEYGLSFFVGQENYRPVRDVLDKHGMLDDDWRLCTIHYVGMSTKPTTSVMQPAELETSNYVDISVIGRELREELFTIASDYLTSAVAKSPAIYDILAERKLVKSTSARLSASEIQNRVSAGEVNILGLKKTTLSETISLFPHIIDDVRNSEVFGKLDGLVYPVMINEMLIPIFTIWKDTNILMPNDGAANSASGNVSQFDGEILLPDTIVHDKTNRMTVSQYEQVMHPTKSNVA